MPRAWHRALQSSTVPRQASSVLAGRPKARFTIVLAPPLLLAALPPLFVALVSGRHGENVPLRDQWRFAPDVIDYVSAQYGWARLWRPSGDHRVVVPRAVMVTLAG